MAARKRKTKHPTIKKRRPIRNAVVVSDMHCGCKRAICAPDGVPLDDGGIYMPDKYQLMLYTCWREFWDEFVPHVTESEPFLVVNNGDASEGIVKQSTTPISHNREDQLDAAYALLAPIVTLCEGRYYHIRGTEAHVGRSAVNEEALAKRLGAKRDEDGKYARWDFWLKLGKEKRLVHFLHHIGTTGSNAYEATAVNKELTEEMNEASRQDERAPDAVVRSHRHRYIEIKIPTARGNARALVTPAWQLKTPFAWRLPGGRLATPQIGGVVLRVSDDGELYTREKVWSIGRTKAEAPTAIY